MGEVFAQIKEKITKGWNCVIKRVRMLSPSAQNILKKENILTKESWFVNNFDIWSFPDPCGGRGNPGTEILVICKHWFVLLTTLPAYCLDAFCYKMRKKRRKQVYEELSSKEVLKYIEEESVLWYDNSFVHRSLF